MIDDPNHNDKIRYHMAMKHAEHVLRETGSKLSVFDDYELMIFLRKHFDRTTRMVHRYQLYDFVKKADGDGPMRFVIAYNKATKKTYLRNDLRSNKNLDKLLVE